MRLSTKNHYYTDQAETYSRDYYNPPQALYLADNQVAVIGAGSSDFTTVYTCPDDKSLAIVYSENAGLEYCGLEVFNNGERVFDIFAEYDDYREIEHLADINKAKHLLQWWA